MVKFIIFILLVAASLGFAEDLPSPVPSRWEHVQPIQNPSQEEKKEAAANDSPTKQLSTTINQTETPNTAQIKPNSSNQPSQPPSDERIVWFTGVLALVGIVQVVVYAFQAYYMREGLKITRESARATQISADAATVSANVAQDTLLLTQRAYVHFDHLRLSQQRITLPQVTGEINVACYFCNSGLTQGTLTTGYTDKIVSGDTPEIPDYASHPNTWSGTETIPKGGEVEYPTSIRLEAAEIEAIKNGAMLFFYGYFSYRDIFNEKREIAFFTQYDPSKERFFKVHRSGYNYST